MLTFEPRCSLTPIAGGAIAVEKAAITAIVCGAIFVVRGLIAGLLGALMKRLRSCRDHPPHRGGPVHNIPICGSMETFDWLSAGLMVILRLVRCLQTDAPRYSREVPPHLESEIGQYGVDGFLVNGRGRSGRGSLPTISTCGVSTSVVGRIRTDADVRFRSTGLEGHGS